MSDSSMYVCCTPCACEWDQYVCASCNDTFMWCEKFVFSRRAFHLPWVEGRKFFVNGSL